jgi:FtsH-binding integral membrane protein
MQLYHQTDQEGRRSLFYHVYSWLALALVLTGLTAYGIAANTQWVTVLATKPFLGLTLFIVQLAVVIIFAGMLSRLSYATALFLFILYALISGVTLAIIFRVYALHSIIQALCITAGMFFTAALYGHVTQADLSKLGSILRIALWGMVLSLLVNLFFKSSIFDLVVSWVGVILFTALTAYDVSMIKSYAKQLEHVGEESYAKIGLFGAFQLYLDFINLFLSLLNITGRRRE